MLRESKALDIDVQANFFRTEKETIIKTTGSRYQATRVVLLVHYSLRCHLDLYSQKLRGIKKAVEENGFLFVESEQSLPPVADSGNQVLVGNCKRLADDCTVLQTKNKRLKIDMIKSERTILSQTEIIDQFRKAGILQRSLDEERQYGTVVMSMLIAEEEAIPDVKWRPVASAILYNKSGNVVMYKGDVVFKQTFHQLKKEGIFNRWI